LTKNQVALVEQAVGVVFDRVRRGRREVRHRRPDAARPERAEQHEHRGRTGPAVIEERERPGFLFLVVLRERDVEHPRGGLRTARVDDHQMADRRRVVDLFAVYRDRVMRDRSVLVGRGDGIVGPVAVGDRIEEGLVARLVLARRCRPG